MRALYLWRWAGIIPAHHDFKQINLDTFGRGQHIPLLLPALKTSRRLFFTVLGGDCVAFATMASDSATFTINDASLTGTQVTSASARFEIHGTVGMRVSGAGIVDGTYVTAVVNDTTVILSAPTSFSGNNRTLTFGKTRSGNAVTENTLTSTPTAMKAPPQGMYIFSSGKLSASTQAVASAGTAISNANCDGVRWKVRWSDIEVTPNNYTWKYLDDAVAWPPRMERNAEYRSTPA